MTRTIKFLGLSAIVGAPLLQSFVVAIPLLVSACNNASAEFGQQPLEQNVNINSLLERGIVSLGRLNNHQIYVAIDSIESEGFLGYVRGTANALVISHFATNSAEEKERGPSSDIGYLGYAVISKLKTVSPADSHKLFDLLNKTGAGKPGALLEITLNVPKNDFNKFPVDRLLIVLFERGQSKESSPGLSRAMPELVKRANNAGIETLIVPSVGYNWHDKNSLTFQDIVGPLFDALAGSRSSTDIYILLYSDWHTFTLEEAVQSINSEWRKIVNKQSSGGRER